MNFPFLKFPIRDFDKIESLQLLRERLLNLLLVSAFFLGTLLLAVALIPVLERDLSAFPLIYALLYIWLIAVTFVRRIPYTVRTASWLFFFYSLGVVNLVLSGFNADAGLFFLTFVSMSALLFDLRRALLAFGISAATIFMAGHFIVTGQFELQLEVPQPLDPLLWIIGGAVFLVTGISLILSLTVLVRGLIANLTKVQAEAEKLEEANQALQQARDNLETKVLERTAELHSTSERLRELVMRSPAVIFAAGVTEDFPVLFLSENVRDLTGYAPEQFIADSGFWLSLIHPEDRPRLLAEAAQIVRLGESVQEYRFLHRDGGYRWMRDAIRLVRSSDGTPLEVVGSWIDVTAEKQAQESYKILLENSMQGIVVFQDNRVVYVNHAVKKTFGYTLEELKLLTPEEINAIIHPDDQARMWSRLQARLAGQAVAGRYEMRVFHQNGETLYLDVSVVPITYRARPALQATVVDLTERRKMEQALRESEETGRVILNATTASLSLLDFNGTVLAANNITAQRLGKELDEILGKIIYQFFPQEVARSRKIQVDRVFCTGKALQYEDSRQGTWFENHIFPILDADGKVTRVVVSARDVTERKRMEQSLAEANEKLEARVVERTWEITDSREQLRKLTGDVVLAQEEERRRVARELHDEAGQALVSMKYGLEAILAEMPGASLPIQNRLAASIQQLDQTMQQIRNLAHSLRPPLLDIADLNLTLKDFCREFSESTGLQIEYRGTALPNLSEAAGLSFFRFLQEALTNVVKHAHATKANVRLKKRAGSLSLTVADNGAGKADTAVEGRGHLGMRERFRMLNGQVEIKSRRGSGFVITASLPCAGNLSGLDEKI